MHNASCSPVEQIFATLPHFQITHPSIISTENPTYFSDRMGYESHRPTSQPNPVIKTANIRKPKQHYASVPIEDQDKICEIDNIFSSSLDSGQGSYDSSIPHHNYSDHPVWRPLKKGTTDKPFKASNTSSSSTFGHKLSQLFWKPKSRSSVSSESRASSTSSSNNTMTIIDPTPSRGKDSFTPDSSLSIYTNFSIDSDSHSSSSNNNNNNHRAFKTMLVEDQEDDHVFTPMFEDCGSNPRNQNVYYNVGPRLSSGSCFRPRSTNSSVSGVKSDQDEDGLPFYYNNASFSTFSKRRHSSSATCSNTFPEDRNGYLYPKKEKNTRHGNNARAEVDVHYNTDQEENSRGNGFSNESSATVVVDTCGDFVDGARKMKNNKNDEVLPGVKNPAFPLYMNRMAMAGNDCDAYCSLCSSSLFTPPNSTDPAYSKFSFFAYF